MTAPKFDMAKPGPLMAGKRGLIMGVANDRLGQGDRPAAERVTLIGECQFGTLARQHPGDAPGDGTVVGDTHD